MDEGGRNIVIYNFQSNYIDEIIGISRNCGPFWEPGMFAVFIITGLFLYNFISTTKLFGFNLIMIVSLISTVSTGGVICGLLFGIMYLTKNNISKRTKIILIPIFCIVVAFVLSLDYIGLKTLEQLENSNVGSDSSRFGAIRTQIHMILNSPILGGEKIENYTRGKTLASGLLLPFVNYGILCGSLFYGFMLKSFTNIFNIGNLNKYKSGIYFFVIILALSISQTILLTPFFETLIIVGLIKTQNNIKSYSYEYTNYLK